MIEVWLKSCTEFRIVKLVELVKLVKLVKFVVSGGVEGGGSGPGNTLNFEF